MPEIPENVRFFYVKSPQFRVIHADGAVGGVTPRGFIHMAFYSERPAIPQSQQFKVEPDGLISEPYETEGKEGIIREMDVDVIMGKQTAIQLRDWLDTRILQLTDIENEVQPDV